MIKLRRSSSVSTWTVYSDTIIHLITLPLTSPHISTRAASWRSRKEESACRSSPSGSHQCETRFPDQPNSQGPASVEKENNFQKEQDTPMHYSISAEALTNREEKEALKTTYPHSPPRTLPSQAALLTKARTNHTANAQESTNTYINGCQISRRTGARISGKAPEKEEECKGRCAVVLITKPEELHAKIANRGEWRGKRTDSRSQTAGTLEVEKDGGLRDLRHRKIEDQLDPECTP